MGNDNYTAADGSVGPGELKILKSLIGKILKLESRMEEGSADSPRSGYSENMYGSFDKEDLIGKIQGLYEEAIEMSGRDSNILYRFAGFLMRAKRFDEAKFYYGEILESIRSSRLMLALIEQNFGDKEVARSHLEEYNRTCKETGFESMIRSISSITLKREGDESGLKN